MTADRSVALAYLFKATEAVAEPTSWQSLTHYLPLFGLDRLLPDNAALLRDWRTLNEDNNRAVADLVATIILDLFRSEYLKRDHFVRQLLSLSRDLLCRSGFSEIVESDLMAHAHADALNLVLVAGCQTAHILSSRVRAADAVCAELLNTGRRVEIVLSGSNPGGSARIRNESVRMHSEFLGLLKERNLDPTKVMRTEVFAEPLAKKTKQNVRQFVNLKRQQLMNRCNVLVISSTFHLVRLCRELEEELPAEHKVDKIIAVLAEGLEPGVVSMLPEYVKSMSFECLFQLFNENEFWPTAPKRVEKMAT